MNKKQAASIIFWLPICVIFFTYLPVTWVQANILEIDNQAYCEHMFMRLWITEEAIDYPQCDFEKIDTLINDI